MDRPKKGFGVPVRKWLRTDLVNLLHYYLSTEKLNAHGLFDTKYVLHLKSIYIENGVEYNMVWTILVFQMWYEMWMNNTEIILD